ncbi:hypothetical protein [Bacillus sp. FJAT-28004]|uniref:hypothetical protein n=1 Tax=Bacillus sp. FJAT-28004 TaxID=1679165 RepID=UPI0006B4ABED|nr:hypothetical protein [Bacillus sp. FJAT-28004]
MSAIRKRYTGSSRPYAIKLVIAGITAGAVSGIVLGFTMKLLEQLTGSAVYVLLLNIDFIKWLPYEQTELLEFILHLAVSIPLGIIYLSLLSLWRSPIGLSLGMSLAVACCTWIPLTQLSERTPATSDVEAMIWWLSGHLLYGAVLSLFGMIWIKKGRLEK